MQLLNIFVLCLMAILAIPVTVFFVQILAATLVIKTHAPKSLSHKAFSLAILIPAHNEALVIGHTLKSLLPQLRTQDSLLVIADNCNDDTAAIAKNLGTNVIERQNFLQRGKGYALDFGLQTLASNPPEVVVIVDADCVLAENALQTLAGACVQHQRPIQALYLMQAQPNPSLKARVAAFAWLVKNKVRPIGFKALGMPCQLMGTGMAFLWEDLTKVSLASGNIVEDMKLGIDFARLSKAPYFMPEALVTSVFPPTAEATNTQRARWEHGHLSVIVSEAPSLILQAIKQKNWQMLGLALDLIVPPLAVLALLSALACALALFTAKFAFMLSMMLLILLSAAVLLAWLAFGREIISFKQLCFAPIYAIAKVPLYLKFFINRQVEWVRSKRD